jgi:hypothetical protein
MLKSGTKVIINPVGREAAQHGEWAGIRGIVASEQCPTKYVRIDLDTKPPGWGYSFVICTASWVKPAKPLSKLEQAIAAYVKAEMAQLGVS